jgi:hypothetical protein
LGGPDVSEQRGGSNFHVPNSSEKCQNNWIRAALKGKSRSLKPRTTSKSFSIDQLADIYMHILLLLLLLLLLLIILLASQPTVGFSLPPHSGGFLDHTQWHTTVGRTPLDE